jgi:hypothetical protein
VDNCGLRELQEAFDRYLKAISKLRNVMDADDTSEWLEPVAIKVVKTFAFLSKQSHITEGSQVLRDACEEIRRLVNSCVRHDTVRSRCLTLMTIQKLHA